MINVNKKIKTKIKLQSELKFHMIAFSKFSKFQFTIFDNTTRKIAEIKSLTHMLHI